MRLLFFMFFSEKKMKIQQQQRDATPLKTVTVGLGERSYPIMIGRGALDRIGEYLQKNPVGNRYCIVSDEHVASLYGKKLLESLQQQGITVELITFPAGEANKHLQTVADLASQLARLRFDRADAIIALGGGVAGDIAGFLASMYMRGIPFVQVPTTLLAQVDSSVGGKTGVDLPEGKNLVGAFYQPRAVFIDPDVLVTLPKEELLGGLAEVIKYGVIWDREFFDFLAAERESILALQDKALLPLLARCCEIKAQVVAEDEREGGLRRILNYGHTIGHAVEAASDFQLIHGLAISIGMRAAADLAVRCGHLEAREAARIKQLLLSYGLPVTIPEDLDREAIPRFLQADKKNVAGRIFFVLPTAIGKVIVTSEVDPGDIDAVLASA